jgi:hypothetical protein
VVSAVGNDDPLIHTRILSARYWENAMSSLDLPWAVERF